MKLIILHLNTVSKPSPMSEGVVEIWINNQPCKGINLTTWHTWAMEATRVATVHDAVKESGQVLPHPSAVFHTYASVDTPWVARTLSHCTPVKRGKVSSTPPAHEATKFRDSICSLCVSTFKYVFIRAQPMWALTETSRGYHLGALNFTHPTFHPVFSPFPYLPRPISNYANISIILLNHIGPPSIERALSRADSNHSSSTICLYN
jgi:hypothetical protein